ncbi:spore germination protein GerPE [Neobacillus cucumis]|uniref:Spore germination protein GerPE n=1 Tax=Neobacillus cucumis TaxID=1740721 RepID=A0A2N5HBT3_9BACI|nr:spore germination protein GerPE [Neobacillus cucumis]PLS02973.1 spore germination protein GerPE [Neobacillus cucumis]
MLARISSVDTFKNTIASFSSVVQLGDSCILNGFSRALAVQREAEVFFGNEGNFPSYSIFRMPLAFPPITETISYIRHNRTPIIKANNIYVTAVSNSSIAHIGNTKHVSMEVRIKHIRQLLPHGHEQEMT